jgi:hypothetical protein
LSVQAQAIAGIPRAAEIGYKLLSANVRFAAVREACYSRSRHRRGRRLHVGFPDLPR